MHANVRTYAYVPCEAPISLYWEYTIHAKRLACRRHVVISLSLTFWYLYFQTIFFLSFFIQPQLPELLPDVLQSKRPENLNDAKRRRLSRADSIPTPVVFDAKYHYTIAVFAEDGNTANKLVYQICCVRAMALANENQPAPNAERASIDPRGDGAESTHMSPSPPTKTQKKKRKSFTICG